MDTPAARRIRRRVWVSGRVQGVFFRESVRKEAESLGVSGFVRNLPDGRVEAAFEGSPEAVEACVVWCRAGPPAARVSALVVQDEPPNGDREFRVLR